MSKQLARPLADRIAALADAPPPTEVKSMRQSARDAAIDALQSDKTHYTTRPGIVPLREWVSTQIAAQYALTVPVDGITITCGATEAEFVSLKTLVPVGSTVLYSGEAAVYQHLARYEPLLGITVTDAPNDTVTAVYIGGVDDAAALLTMAVERDWWVIWSTQFASADIGVSQINGAAERTIIIGELEDKLPGWRIGWMAGSEQSAKLRAYKQSMTICSPSISQWAAYGLVSANDDE